MQTQLEWVGPVLEDLRRFLEQADQGEIASDIQDILDRYADRLQTERHDLRRQSALATSRLPDNAVPFPLHRRSRG
ncbi:hypothetical protein [Allosediminivita pacifica]|nr:hypothetical protein [Allosediminivita pacifica]